MHRVREITGIIKAKNIPINFRDWKNYGKILKEILNYLRRNHEDQEYKDSNKI
jgi:hypothetical protein